MSAFIIIIIYLDIFVLIELWLVSFSYFVLMKDQNCLKKFSQHKLLGLFAVLMKQQNTEEKCMESLECDNEYAHTKRDTNRVNLQIKFFFKRTR